MDSKNQIGILQSHHRAPFDDSASRIKNIPDDGDNDVVFHVGREIVMRIPAKKSVLSKKNDVFDAMFYGPYTQARESLRRRQGLTNELISNNHLTHAVEDIYDPDVDGRAFKNLISFLYGETVELRSALTALETLHAAEKYLCGGLAKICATYLANQLNQENVLYVYQRTCMYHQVDNSQSVSSGDTQPSAPSLEQFHSPNIIGSQLNQTTQQLARSSWCSFLLNSCLEFIDRNASAVLLSEDFEELDSLTVESIVKRDGLHLKNESEVLAALLRWAVFECHRRQLDPSTSNQRQVLGHLIWHVRFLAMPTKEFLHTVTKFEVLASDEFSALNKLIKNQESIDQWLADHSHYSLLTTKSRMYLTSKVNAIQSAYSIVDNGSIPASSQKTCLTEKIFVCLACIFE